MAKTSQKRIIVLSILLILFFSSLVYLFRLDKTPVHLIQDELAFSLNAYSISETLHDANGRFLPFYFWHLDSFWATPIIVYLTSIFLKFLPLSEATIRVPSVFVGLISIFLIMLLTQKIFKDKKFIILSGILVATTPILFIQSRLLLDNLYIVPFVLLWLLFLKIFLEKRNDLALFVSGLSLGIGIHSYHAAKIMMPIYFITTMILLSPKTKRDFKSLVVLLLGFLIPIVAFIPWLANHPDTLLNQVSYVGSIDKTVDVGRGIWGVFSFSRLGGFISSYLS
ncbi:glycosyltransferase family 39 protein, partial [Candidatus Woesebacteria bacterium]|nr:glycosyltransferase family 39 protein [Candidatus Woesebacteria bacterium]